jgi:ElaB/YqjD/DUF883 family membrane-anchored ribosome-binding protein
MSAARKMANGGHHLLRDTAASLSHSMHGLGDMTRETAAQALDRSRRSLVSTAHCMESFVEEQPVRATLLAVGLGCLIAALVVRR